jgi:cytidyltransferase-like protein
VKVVIVSGYFNPLHGGHVDMIESAWKMGDKMIVVVNNDEQQMLKKGKIILDQQNRLRLMRTLKGVDEVVLSVDTEDVSQVKTLEMIARQHPGDKLIFANGGDRSSEKSIPETEVCKKHNIEMRFDGGEGKPDSSTRINQATGHET